VANRIFTIFDMKVFPLKWTKVTHFFKFPIPVLRMLSTMMWDDDDITHDPLDMAHDASDAVISTRLYTLETRRWPGGLS
jgi:hypothetical protein